MYARTSGTTGVPKLVPVTPTVLDGLRRAQRAMAYAQYRAGVLGGKILAIAGTAHEVTLPGGVPAGATTGLIYETMPRLMRAKYVIPIEVAIADTASILTIVRSGSVLMFRDRHGNPPPSSVSRHPWRGRSWRATGWRRLRGLSTAARPRRRGRARAAPDRAGARRSPPGAGR
jgi:hypothetical protein